MARTQPNRGGNSQAAGVTAGRGLLIVLFAAAIGVLLLARAVNPDGGDAAAESTATTGGTVSNPEDGGPDSTSTSGPPESSITTIAEKSDPSTVAVLVANGRGVPGAAKANADALAVQNYDVLTPTDYPESPTPATRVYYIPDHQADAMAVAQALTIDNSAVAPLPADGLPLDVAAATVVVVLGADGKGLSPS